MSVYLRFFVVVSLAVSQFSGWRLIAQEDVADVTSQDLRADKDENKRYFLIGPRKGVTPKKGYGLLVVLPGGEGSADFHLFVKRIYKNAVPQEYLLAQPVAVKWTEKQAIVWPTEKNRTEGMKFSTEAFVDAVIKHVGGRHQLDPERTFILAWSSSGPVAYAVSLTSKKVTGSFIAMSVFRTNLLPPLETAKGHSYFLYHSPDDRVCPIWMAEQATKELERSGARVKLATYKGGHGWRSGPLTMRVHSVWVSYRGGSKVKSLPFQLDAGERVSELHVQVGTPGLGKGTFAALAVEKGFPAGLHPNVGVIVPSKTDSRKTIKAEFLLKERC
jgi:predicted esterase